MSKDDQPAIAGPSHTVREFCKLEGISASFFYKLLRQGLGPRTYHLGKAHRITEQARRDWHRSLERDYKQQPAGDDEQIGGAA